MAGKEGSKARRGGKSPAAKKKPEKQVIKKGRNPKKGDTTVSNGSGGRGKSKSPPPQKKQKQQQVKGKNKKGGKPQPKKDKPVSAEDLDRGMDDYWAKSKDKAVVEKKLDDDLDGYWAAKAEGGEDGANEDTAAFDVGDGVSDAKEADDKEAGEA